jgi:hypothetical protein
MINTNLNTFKAYMKLTNYQIQYQHLKIKLVTSALFTTIALIHLGSGTLQGQGFSSSGTNGGNVALCPCPCTVIVGTEVATTTKCGDECAVITIIKNEKFTDFIFEDSTDCVSGLKMFSQEVTATGIQRSTKLKGILTYKTHRTPPIENLSADCSGCPPCPPYVENYECGQLREVCEPRENDFTEVRGDKVDKGCVSTPT